MRDGPALRPDHPGPRLTNHEGERPRTGQEIYAKQWRAEYGKVIYLQNFTIFVIDVYHRDIFQIL